MAPALAAITALLIGAPVASGHHPPPEPGERVPDAVARALGGKVAVTQSGLYKVRTRSGHEFTTHGPDHVDTATALDPDHGSDLTLGESERAPACADSPSSDHYTEFLYAYPSTEPNNIAAERANIQAIVRRMNWLLNAESQASGGPPADLVVRCSTTGAIRVSALPIPGPTTFANLITAAQDAGFANERVDYSIFLDGTIGGPAGIANWSQDDRLAPDNQNNNPPGSGSDYAVTIEAFWDTYVPFHELGHNQGAVQPSAPGASPINFGHVTRPGDVMGYEGPGTCQGLYPGTSTFHFDCGWNTYFDAAPESGEWLESHWNLGSPLNRFIEFPPVGTISGVVRDRVTGEPLEDAAITVTPRGDETRATTRELHTDGGGEYSVPFLPGGAYSVTAERWGHRAMTSAVAVKAGETSDGGFRLMELPRHDIGGTVMAGTEPLEGAVVEIEGAPLDAETAGADGTFSFDGIPTGTHRFVVSYLGCAEEMTFTRRVGGRETFDFELPRARDTYGHTCALTPVDWVDGTTPVSFPDLNNSSVAVPLPFTFSHYGVAYDTLHVSTNGYMSFTPPGAERHNASIPDPVSPNAALYPFWDNLFLLDAALLPPPFNEFETDVRIATRGTAPTREFVLEYSNVQSGSAYLPSWDFEVILYEEGPGRVLFQYRGLGGDVPDENAALNERGVSATIGIENADGSDALQSSFNEPMPGNPETLAILFQAPPGGIGF